MFEQPYNFDFVTFPRIPRLYFSSNSPTKKIPSKHASSALFSAIEQLDVDDNVAAKKRKKDTRNSVSKSKAARSQNELCTSLMEARIMLQRAIFASKSTMDEKENYSKIKKQCK